MAIKTPIIAIVGRPNVGKSTLFNRIVGKKQAVVEDLPGVTRDRNYALVKRFPIPFYLVDTGGFEVGSDVDELATMVVEQTRVAAEEADIVLAIFDAKSGLHPGDSDVMEYLRRFDKPVYFVANKCDGVEQATAAAEFYSLGISEITDISALHGRNVKNLIADALRALPDFASLKQSFDDKQRAAREIEAEVEIEIEEHLSGVSDSDDELGDDEIDDGEFAEEVLEEGVVGEDEEMVEPVFAPVYVPEESDLSEREYEKLYATAKRAVKEQKIEQEEENTSDEDVLPSIECISFSIVGRPNVGKSTLLNTLTGEQRAVTADMAGTTRDNVDAFLTRDGQQYKIVDTAGLRKKARVSDSVERYSTMRALSAISESDVIVMIIDATEGPSEQDAKILGLAHDQGIGIVLAVNKWDLVEKSHKTVKEFTEQIRVAFKFAPYAPIVYVSALTGRRCPRIIEAVHKVAHERQKRVSTNRLNRLLERSLKRRSLPVYRGRRVKLFFAAQVAIAPPRFILFFNFPKAVHFSTLRFLKNSIREEFGFEGSEIKLSAKKRGGDSKR